MKLDRFLRERQPEWDALEGLLGDAGAKPERLAPDRLRRLGSLYRGAAADLAFARRAFPGDPVTRRLERLVLDGRQQVYADSGGRRSLWHFLSRGYWQRIRERPWALATALLLLFGPMLLAAVWAIDDPAAAVGVVPDQFQGAADPGGRGPISAGQSTALSSQIFTNNIRVTFLAVAGGMLAGLGTAAVTIFNGGFVGAIMGLTIENGSSADLFRLILPHGVLELSCISISAAAGLRLGWSMIEPGTLTRARSLQREAGPAMELVLGTMPWLVVAGLVEGYVTPNLGSLTPAIAVGGGLGALFWGLAVWRGGSEPGAGLGAQVGAHAGGGQPAGGGLEHARAGALELVGDAGPR